MQDILSLRSFDLLTALVYKIILSLTDDSYSPFMEKSIIAHSVPLMSSVTSHTFTQPNLYFVNSLASVFSDRDL
jgi:hypothetical protein